MRKPARRRARKIQKFPRPPGYELFFAPIEVVLNPTERESVEFAYFCSKFGHLNDVRDDGTRVFDHPKSTAWIYIDELGGRDFKIIRLGLLHDIPEDSYLLSSFRISHNFGEEAALDLRALTKLPKGKETTKEYLGRVIARGPRTILVKLCDRLHNVRTLRGCSKRKRLEQIAETRRYHLPLLIPALRAYGGEWKSYADQLERKIQEALVQYA